jgi:UDP:flavonoid glycosyltransferase YjiC (YdhE family)
VAIPVGYDQPGVAARIAYRRVGEFLELEDLAVERIQQLIQEVLYNAVSAGARSRSSADAKSQLNAEARCPS